VHARVRVLKSRNIIRLEMRIHAMCQLGHTLHSRETYESYEMLREAKKRHGLGIEIYEEIVELTVCFRENDLSLCRFGKKRWENQRQNEAIISNPEN
jgi:hypothetical protein